LVQRLRRNVKFHAPFVCDREWRQDRERQAKDERGRPAPAPSLSGERCIGRQLIFPRKMNMVKLLLAPSRLGWR
jgi:hypothetical protein